MYMKVLFVIKCVKSCKKESLIPAFAKVNLSIKNANRKLKLCIARMEMESEMVDKHHEKKKLKKDMVLTRTNLKLV